MGLCARLAPAGHQRVLGLTSAVISKKTKKFGVVRASIALRGTAGARSIARTLSHRPACPLGRRTLAGPLPSVPMNRLRFRPSLEQLEARDVPALVSFAVNEAISSVTLSGAFGASGVGDSLISEQGPGSLHTAVDGTIAADVDETNGTIRFLNATDLILANCGSWQPGIGAVEGSAAANLGAFAISPFFSVFAAVRGGEVTFTSGTLALGGSNPRTFDSTQLTGMFAAGTVDYTTNLPIPGGTVALTGVSGSNTAGATGTLDRTGTTLTLTIPVNVVYVVPLASGLSAFLTINGSLQAFATVAPSGGAISEPAPQALRTAAQIVQTLQRGGTKLAGFAFGETNGDATKDLVLAFRQRSGKLLVATLDGLSGGVLGAFQPFSRPIAKSAQVKAVLVNLDPDTALEIGVLIDGGGTGIPRVSAFDVTGSRLL